LRLFLLAAAIDTAKMHQNPLGGAHRPSRQEIAALRAAQLKELNMQQVQVRSRHTVRRNPSSNREVQYLEPWVYPEAKPDTPLGKLETAFFASLKSVDALEDYTKEIAASGKYTTEGIASNALEYAASKLAPSLKRAKLAVDRVREELAAKRATLKLQPADKTDVAGQTRRLWKLEQLQKMSNSERNLYLAREDIDPEIEMAILEAPQFSGALPSDLQRFRDKALRAWYGEQTFTEIAEIETGITIADRALNAAREAIAQDVGGERVFNEAAKPFEDAAGGRLWLKKVIQGDTEVVKVFKKRNEHSGEWVTATELEVASGGYHANYDEWQQAGGEWPSIVKAA
jgi:hypothetical protein